jgi:2-polyprenyl-3-methyl-5-hydroxy-6-metoxy-1,4-benzoquinol methylase
MLVSAIKSIIKLILYDLYRRVDVTKNNTVTAFELINDLQHQIDNLESNIKLLMKHARYPSESGLALDVKKDLYEQNHIGLNRQMPFIIENIQPSMTNVVSQFCTQAQFEDESFNSWCIFLKEEPAYHRKIWEHCYIMQALLENGKLVDGAKGLGFGVGHEPLSAAMATYGCIIVATDMGERSLDAKSWALTGQHASSLDQLNQQGICPKEKFVQNVTFRALDMNSIDEDLKGFDFIWSSCALEHLGSIELGIKYIKQSMKCLKPGGVAVHTTELNMHSNDLTIEIGPTVLFRRKDIEKLQQDLLAAGHSISLNFTEGKLPFDYFVDSEPCSKIHLKYLAGNYVTTSFGIVITKGK